MKIALIFVLSKEDVNWATKYLSNHKNEKVKILAPTIESQLELLKRDLPSLDFFKITPQASYLIANDYMNQFSENGLVKETAVKMTKILNYFKRERLTLLGYKLEDLLIYALFRNCANFVYAQKIFKKIIIQKPDKIYFPHIIIKDGLNFQNNLQYLLINLAELCKIRIQTNFYQTISLKDILNTFIVFTDNKIRKFLSAIKQLLLIFNIEIIKNLKTEDRLDNKQLDFLFYSGGLILRYYYNFFSIVKNGLNFRVITYKQSLEDRLLAYKNKLPLLFINSKNTKPNKLSISNIITTMSDYGNYLSIEERILGKNIIKYLKGTLPKLVQNIVEAQRVFAYTKPSLFISTHDPSSQSLTYILLAQKFNILTLSLQHGLAMHPLEWNFKGDLIACWGKIGESFIQSHNPFNNKKIVITGFPKIDELLIKTRQAKKQTNLQKQSLNLSIILTIYTPFEEHTTKFLHELYSSLNKIFQPVEVSIRFHAGQNIEDCKRLAEFYKIPTIVNSKISLDQFIQNSDVVICWDTTAIIWAMLYQKPLFHTSPLWGKGIYPTSKYKAAWIPQNAEDLVNKINQLVDNFSIVREIIPGQKKFLEDFAGPLDGKSSDRLLQLINKLAKKQKRLL